MARKVLAFIFLCMALGAHAQTKIDLGTQAKGQVQIPNAVSVLNMANAQAQHGGANQGIYAHNGYAETFQPDLYCVGGALSGWNFIQNVGCNVGTIHQAASGAFYGYRNTYYGGAYGSTPFPPGAWSFHFTANFTANTSQYVGFTTCAVNDTSCFNSGASDEMAYSDSTGIGLSWGGTKYLLFPMNQTSTHNIGFSAQDDAFGWSSLGNSGYYDITVIHPGDGTVTVSATPADGSGQFCFTTTSSCYVSSTRIALADPSGSVHQFGFRGSQAADFIGNIGYAAIPIYQSHFKFAVAPGNLDPFILPVGLHADGSEWNYNTSSQCSDCQDVFIWVPPNYKPGAANPVVLHIKGVEQTVLSALSTFDNVNSPDKVLDELMQSGYVVISVGMHSSTNYGNPQAIADIANAWTYAKQRFSLADKPYIMADSAGGISTLNAITHGAIKPRAVEFYSANTNLACDAEMNQPTPCTYQAGSQLSLIETAFGFSSQSQYAAYTAGYDPNDVMAHPYVDRVNTSVATSYPLLAHAAQVIAAIPMYFNAGPQDTTVFNGPNSSDFANYMNTLNPGIAYCNCSLPGVHVNAAMFDGGQLISFFQSH